MRSSTALALALCAASAVGCKRRAAGASEVKVTNGRDEASFPYVVRVTMDGKSSCTGSFVSDSLLVTAAHCVDRAEAVDYEGTRARRADFFIHPSWPRQGTNCKQEVKPEFDLALVRFPANTYKGSEVARLPHREAEAGDRLLIIGFGNNLIQPYERYCTVPEAKKTDGKCHFMAGTRSRGTSFDYRSVFSWSPVRKSSATVCPAECDVPDFRTAFTGSRRGESLDGFIQTSCGGNIDSRGYKETGGGVKRSGFNTVFSVTGGIIEFRGGLGGKSDGENAASGRGDSGGPLLLEGEADTWYLAGATSGGALMDGESGDTVKRSKYVSILSDANLAWLRGLVAEKNLDFPDFNDGGSDTRPPENNDGAADLKQ